MFGIRNRHPAAGLVGPNSQTLQQRLAGKQAELGAALKAVSAQKSLMARALMTPAAHEKAQQKLQGLEANVTRLEGEVKALKRLITVAAVELPTPARAGWVRA